MHGAVEAVGLPTLVDMVVAGPGAAVVSVVEATVIGDVGAVDGGTPTVEVGGGSATAVEGGMPTVVVEGGSSTAVGGSTLGDSGRTSVTEASRMAAVA